MTIYSHVVAGSNKLAFCGQDGSVAVTLKTDYVDAGGRHSPPAHTPRLRLKRRAPQSGYVDGAWWPHSMDLAAELPDLLSVLSVRLGPIGRVIYNVNEWVKTQTKLVAGGRTVRLDGYLRQPVSTIELLGLNSGKILLLVIPPHVDAAKAHAIMMAAAGPSNASTVEDLLRASAAEVDPQASAQT
jgi:hypothetical protein